MSHHWENHLPEAYRTDVIEPVMLERFREPSSNSERIFGLDADGERCFYYHAFTLTDERFDIDEMPVLVDVYYERVVSWKLRNGSWLRIKAHVDQLERCNKQMTTQEELTETLIA